MGNHPAEQPEGASLRRRVHRELAGHALEVLRLQLGGDATEDPPEKEAVREPDEPHPERCLRSTQGVLPCPDTCDAEPGKVLEDDGVGDHHPADPFQSFRRPGDAHHAADVMDHDDEALLDRQRCHEPVEEAA